MAQPPRDYTPDIPRFRQTARYELQLKTFEVIANGKFLSGKRKAGRKIIPAR
jgi:hypothetical protein